MKLSIDLRLFFGASGEGGGSAARLPVLREDTITAARPPAGRASSAVVDIRDGCANYLPTDRIAGATAPSASSAGKSEGPTGWTTGFNVDSVGDVARIPAALTVGVS